MAQVETAGPLPAEPTNPVSGIQTDSAANGDYAIQVEGLNKYYGPFHALRDLSFHVRKGEVVGFLGPNGAGKTTTMRIITGYMPANSGSAQVAGFDTFTQSLDVRQHIGYLPENVPLYLDMSVREYLTFCARLHHVKHVDAAVDRAMERVNIEEREGQLLNKLSKGYRQRVGLAQAIVHEPDVLVLDEPTIGLDPSQIIQVRNLIKELGKEHTLILSTHILPEVSQVCSRVLIINRGRIVAEDSPQRLTSGGAERVYLQVAKPSAEIPDQLRRIPGVLDVSLRNETSPGAYEVQAVEGADRRTEIASMAVQRGWGVLELRPLVVSLEEVFLKLTTSDEAAEQDEAEGDTAQDEEMNEEEEAVNDR